MKHHWYVLIGLSILGLLAASCQPTATSADKANAKGGASSAAAAATLFVGVDVVQGSTNLTKEQAAAKSCVANSRFSRNSQIVWRARVMDPKTGETMDDKALKSVQIKLANGKAIDMKYGPHPKDPPGEAFWTGSFVVPKDAPTGTLDYTVVATGADARTGTFAPIKVASSVLTILDEVIPDAKG